LNQTLLEEITHQDVLARKRDSCAGPFTNACALLEIAYLKLRCNKRVEYLVCIVLKCVCVVETVSNKSKPDGISK
jgi:hypothetical protein